MDKKGELWDMIVKIAGVLLALVVVYLIYLAVSDQTGSVGDNIREMLKFKDYDGDGAKDFFDTCACGSIYDDPLDLFDNGLKYCVTNFKPAADCTNKNLLDGKSIMSWSEVKSMCYYSNSDCKEFIMQEYAKEETS